MIFNPTEIGPNIYARSLRVKNEVFQKGGLIRLDSGVDPKKALGQRVYSRFAEKMIIDEDRRLFNVTSFNEFLKKEPNLNFLRGNLILRREEQPNSSNMRQAIGRVIEKTPRYFKSIYQPYCKNGESITSLDFHDSVMDALQCLINGEIRSWNSSKEHFDQAGMAIDLSGAVFSGQKGFADLELSRANLDYVDLSWSTLSHLELVNSQLRNANLRNSIVSDVDLSYAVLPHADLIDAHLVRVEFAKADITGAFFIGTTFEDCDLSKTNKDKAIFRPILS